MEDAHIACLDLKTDLTGVNLSEDRGTFLEGIAVFGVFDGHGGTYILVPARCHNFHSVGNINLSGQHECACILYS